MNSAAGHRKKGARKYNGNGVGAAVANLVRNVVDNAVGLAEEVANDSMRVASAAQELCLAKTGSPRNY